MLTVYGREGAVAVPMVSKRALELAQELLTRGVAAIKGAPIARQSAANHNDLHRRIDQPMLRRILVIESMQSVVPVRRRRGVFGKTENR